MMIASLILAMMSLGPTEPLVTWRGAVSYEEIARQTDPYAAVDVMAQFGVNVITRPPFYNVKTNQAAELRKFYAYARSKGVRVLYMPKTAVWRRCDKPKDVTTQNWPCVKLFAPWEDLYFCWADDALTEASAERFADFLAYVGAEDAIVMLHPVDTGPDGNPENWQGRCAKCRAKYGDDDRWKASAKQLNIWTRVLRRRCPQAIFGSCAYPYTYGHLDRPPATRTATLKRDLVEYYRHLDEEVKDPDFFFGSWIFSVSAKEEVEQIIRRHPVMQMDTFPEDTGVFSTTARRVALSTVRREPTIYVPYADDYGLCWERHFFMAAHLTDPSLPGTIPFDGKNYYDFEQDHTGPKECFETTLRDICVKFWGEELTPDMMAFLTSGVLPGYILAPVGTVDYWNRLARNPLFDPNRDYDDWKAKGPPPHKDTPARMRDQAERAAVACDAITRAYEKAKGLKLGRVQRDSLEYRTKATRRWLAAARAQANLREFAAAFSKGDFAAAGQILSRGEREFEADFTAAEKTGRPLGRDRAFVRETFAPRFVRARESLDLAAGTSAGAAAAATPAKAAAPRLRNPVEWSGTVVVDRPLIEPNRNLLIKPGTRVLFRGEGRLEFSAGTLVATDVTFEADGVLTNANRIALPKGLIALERCTFRNLVCQYKRGNGSWGSGAVMAGGVSGSRIVGCRFENSSAVSLAPSADAVYAHNEVRGGDVALNVNGPCHRLQITDNRFIDQSFRVLNLTGGEEVFIARNVFEDDPATKGIGMGVSGWSPGASLRVLGNTFRGLQYPIRLNGMPASGAVVAGNRLEGCGPVEVKEDPSAPCVKINNQIVSDMDFVERNLVRFETRKTDPAARKWIAPLPDPNRACERVSEAEGAIRRAPLRADGTWPDIDYKDRNGVIWPLCNKHLGRTCELAKLWRTERDAALAEAARRALGWWLKEDPQVPNWWWNQIGAPQRVGLIAVCLKSQLTAAETADVVKILSRAGIRMTGQNRVWLSRVTMMKALLTDDEKLLAKASAAIADEIAIKGVEGIQKDWSFHQHGNQPQFGNYGLSYIENMSGLASVFAGTRFAFPSEKMTLLNNLFEKGYAWTMWKGRLDVSCIARQWWPDANALKGKTVLDAAEVLGLCGGESARIAADFKALRGPVGFKTFPTSAMTFYRQSGWMASHKGGTKKIRGTETWIIGDNLKGQHQQDGSLCTTVTGREYENIAPLWNWRKLPGITSCIDLPPSKHNDKYDPTGPNQLEDYRGEETADGGIVTFGVEREGIRYHQKITFAPDGILAETTGICCTNDSRVATCVEAANAAPNAGIISQTATETRLRNGDIEYIVSAPKEAVEVFIGERTGDYHDFMAGWPSTKHTGRIFEVTVNHGKMPKNAACRYRILPSGTGR